MARHEEKLNGGLWTLADPGFLEEGQLSDLQNAHYMPGTQALWRILGRTSFGAASATGVDVVGLRDVRFDNAQHTLIAMTSASYVTAAVGDTGTFGVLTGSNGGLSLDRAHFKNRYYLANGATASPEEIGTNRVVYLSATAAATTMSVRQHGMLSVIAKPATATATGTFSQPVTGYYEYWTTEVAKFDQDNVQQQVESGFEASTGPVTVFVVTSNAPPIIAMPAPRNPGFTTHWRIYRSPKKDKASDTLFPAGFMIAEQSTATAFVVDSQTVASASSLPTLFNTNPAGPFATWASASALASADGVYASATVAAAPFYTSQPQGVYGFSFGGFSGSVKGIVVEFKAYISSGTSPVPVNVTIGKRRQDTGGFEFGVPVIGPIKFAGGGATITSTAVGSPDTLTIGGSDVRWFASDNPGLVDSDFSNTFMVSLSISKPSTSIGVDYVKVTVYYASTIDSVIPFPTVVYTFGDTTTQVAKNGPPPSSSTIDVFQDSLVVNDKSNPGVVRYSYPGDADAFPRTYYLDFDTDQNDRVTLVKVVNDVVIVGLNTSIWRVNYLPSERDASFDRGKARSAISRDVGVVNEMCATVFTLDGKTEWLAFISDWGIHATDGFQFMDMTAGLEWNNIIATANATAIALVHDPALRELRFVYRNDNLGAESYRDIRLSYDGDHVTNGRLKISGMSTMRNFDTGSSTFASLNSIWPVRRITGETQAYLGYGGTATAAGAGSVYRENGNTIPAQDPTMRWQTRRMYLSGLGSEFKLDTVHGYFGSYSGSPIVTYTAKNVKTDGPAETTSGSVSKTLVAQKLGRFQFNQLAEGLRLAATASGQVAFSIETQLLDGRDFDIEDAGT